MVLSIALFCMRKGNVIERFQRTLSSSVHDRRSVVLSVQCVCRARKWALHVHSAYAHNWPVQPTVHSVDLALTATKRCNALENHFELFNRIDIIVIALRAVLRCTWRLIVLCTRCSREQRSDNCSRRGCAAGGHLELIVLQCHLNNIKPSNWRA